MGTRGCIAKPEGDGWAGRYHHWDSYPEGLGRTLQRVHAELDGNLDEMIALLIDGEPVGWSTIVGKDMSLPKGWHDSSDRDALCVECGKAMWRHYAQYYPETTSTRCPWVNGARRKGLLKRDEIVQLGHSFEAPPEPLNPQSYSSRGEEGDQWIRSTDEDVSGAEWCYVLTPAGIMVLEGDFGAFGMGGGNWHGAVLVPWDDPEAMTSEHCSHVRA